MRAVNPLLFVPIGLVLSATIALLAYRRGSLSRSGVFGAMLTGTLHFGFGGLTWGLTLIAFFVSSTLLSHYKKREKAPVVRQFAKGGRRDFGQALANGGVGAALAVCFNLHPTGLLFVAFVGVMATVAADTWATELGIPLSPSTTPDHDRACRARRYIGGYHRARYGCDACRVPRDGPCRVGLAATLAVASARGGSCVRVSSPASSGASRIASSVQRCRRTTAMRRARSPRSRAAPTHAASRG